MKTRMKTDEQDWADRFSRDVDSLLNGAGRADSEPPPTEYRQALDMARILATTDLSDESQVRHTLRRRLLNQIGTREGWQLRKEYVMRTFFRQRRAAVILASATLAAFLVITLAWPGGLTTAAQGIYDVIQRIVVGPNTQVVQIDPQTRSEPRPTPPDMWYIDTEVGGFGGNVLPDADPTVHSVANFEEAQDFTSFHILAPCYLPEGYTLREIKLAGGDAFLFYGGAGHDIILMQTLVGPQPSDDPNVRVGVKVGWFTDSPVEEVSLEGRTAVWLVDAHILTWEADEINYNLGGLDLSLEEAVRIAESLE